MIHSEVPSPGPVSLADRDWFQAHRDDARAGSADAGLYASRPFVSRLTGWHNMAFSRRMQRADGSFAGVATAHKPFRADELAARVIGLIGAGAGAASVRHHDAGKTAQTVPSLPICGA